MTRRILVGIAGLLICAAAFAAGTSIWNATARGTVAVTDRIPVATSSSSGPLYVTPATIKAYIIGETNTVTGSASWIPGGANGNTLSVDNAYAWGGSFGQTFGVLIGVSTSDDTPTRLSSVPSNYGPTKNFAIPSGYAAACSSIFIATDGSGGAGFECNGIATNIGGTTALVTGSCASIGTPSGSLSTAGMAMQANDTDDTLEFVFTGVSATTINVGGDSRCSTTYMPD